MFSFKNKCLLKNMNNRRFTVNEIHRDFVRTGSLCTENKRATSSMILRRCLTTLTKSLPISWTVNPLRSFLQKKSLN